MAQTPKKPQKPEQSVHARRVRSRHEREQRKQRIVITITAVAIGLALLAILIGLGYERLWLPSRPVVAVNGQTLSRREYSNERRNEIARNITNTIKNLELISTLGPELTQQIASQIPTLNNELSSIDTAAVDNTTLNNWIDRQLILKGAQELNLQANEEEIAQALIADLGSTFPEETPATPTPVATAAVSDTETLTDTLSATPTATEEVEATEEPTATPTPTPQGAQAQSRQEAIIGKLYDSYLNTLLNYGVLSELTLDDFKTALHEQYQRNVLVSKIEEHLLPDASFTASTDPTSIETRHILFAVTEPLTSTNIEAAFEARRADAEAVLAQLRDGADFAELAKEYSEDAATSEAGGRLPSFDKDGATTDGNQFDPAFVAAVAELEEGEISDLVRTPFGWHIIKLDNRTIPTYEEQIKAARQDVFNKWLQEQRAASTINFYPPQDPTPTPEPTQEVTPLPRPTVSLYNTPLPTEEPTPEPTPEATAEAAETPTATLAPTPTSTLTPTATP